MILIFAAYAVLGLSFTIGKMLLALVPPIFLIALRMTIAGVILLVAQYALSGSCLVRRSDCALFGLLSLIHIAIPYSVEFVAMESIAPSCAAFMFNLSPFFCAFFSYLYFGECMTMKKWIGLLLALGAMVFFFQPSFDRAYCAADVQPYIFMVISVATCSLAWIYFRMLVTTGGYSPMLINGWAMLLGGLESYAASWYLEPQASLPWDNMQLFALLLAAIILITNIIFYNLYGFLLKKYTATLLAFIGFTMPAFVALYDWYFLDLTISSSFVIAMLLVGVGIYIFYEEELRQGYVGS